MPVKEGIHIIGHICHDKINDGYILGGTASYSSLIASNLFKNVALTTSFGDDFNFLEVFTQKAIEISNIEAPQTTVFENVYHANERTQYLHRKARDICIDDLKDLSEKVVFFCPIANEISGDLLAHKSGSSLFTATIQGWLRSFEADGKVVEKRPLFRQLKGLDIVIMSNDDISTFPDIIERLITFVPIVVVTKGRSGAEIHHNGSILYSPAYETNAIDLTGAGDVFAIAFVYAFSEQADLLYASSFAHSAASISIEGVGVQSLPTLKDILERQEMYNNRYLRK